jgi:hypothetical protein
MPHWRWVAIIGGMTAFLHRYLGMTVDEAGLAVTIIVPVLGLLAVVARLVWSSGRVGRRMRNWVGVDHRRYSHWFLEQHGKLKDIYLRRIHELSLSEAYVSLSFGAGTSAVAAAQVLADPHATRIVVTGDPGTGKSTLLKAYGSSLFRSRRGRDDSDLRLIDPGNEIPFFVPLRHFAHHAPGPRPLTQYLLDEVLGQAGIRDAREFLRGLLRRREVLVMLDGLDEVPGDKMSQVEAAINEFIADNGDLPTAKARVILSCRRQNFDRIESRWIPTFAPTAYTLAPLRDAEIYRYIRKRRADFTGARTPDSFFRAIQASDTMDLHRVPLVLAISVGLYVTLDAYEIPRSVGEFYKTMIDELLRRHDFRGERSANVFTADDKLKFLRTFAVDLARRPDRFEDFSFEDAVDAATEFSRHMTSVAGPQAKDFILEIIDRSGLLKPASGQDEYVFAHRSIHEYLIAAEFIREPTAGSAELLRRANDRLWQNIIELFVSLDLPNLDSFIEGLAGQNLPLAGYCLAGAPVSPEVASGVLQRLFDVLHGGTDVALHLPALVAAVRSPRSEISAEAVLLVSEALLGPAVGAELNRLAGDPDVLVVLLNALSETNRAEIAALVPGLASLLPPEDTRVIAPLWRSLAVTGMMYSPAATPVAARLLDAVMSVDGLQELQTQPAYQFPDGLVALPVMAYPFGDGVAADSNLVTLLGVADTLDAQPTEPNRFFVAKADGALDRVERARGQTLRFQPFMPVRILFFLLLIAAIGLSAYWLVNDRHTLLHPLGWWSIALWVIPPMAASLVAAVLAGSSAGLALGRGSKGGRAGRSRREVVPNLLVPWMDDQTQALNRRGQVDRDVALWFFLAPLWLATVPYAIACAPMARWFWPAELVVATLVIWGAFWVPAASSLGKGRTVYLRRPTVYVDMYEDPRSRHWVTST